MSRTTLPLLALLLAAAACTPTTDELELDESTPHAEVEDEDAPASEHDGADVRAATFERPDDPERRAQIDEVRRSSCSHDRRAEAPVDLAPVIVARGVAEPGFRVEEDQREASLDLQPELDDEGHAVLEPVRAEVIEAQERYLDQTLTLEAGFVGSERELADAKAQLKERVLEGS